ncbi:MAG: tail fiber domain-containing protein [Salibacteraceae bacterium]
MKKVLNYGLIAVAFLAGESMANAQTFGAWDSPRVNTGDHIGIGTPDNPNYTLDVLNNMGSNGILSNADGFGLHGISNGSFGVMGEGPDAGVHGSSSNIGVIGEGNAYGVYAVTGSSGTGVFATGLTAVRGQSSNTTGSIGVHGSGPDVGVWGESFAWGVWGDSDNGNGVRGTSSNGYAGYFVGLTWCTQGVWAGSDARYKKNVEPIANALSTLQQIDGLTYEFRNEEFANRNFTDGRSYGFIAQDLQKVMPELVKSDEDGYLGINYSLMTPLLVEAVKEQQTIIDEQARKIDDLETALTAMEARLSDMETKTTKANDAQNSSLFEDAPEMQQNRPNPFQESTSIEYYLPTSVNDAVLVVYNALGNEVTRVRLEGRGYSKVDLQAYDWENGNYIYTIFADGQVVNSKQMILAR